MSAARTERLLNLLALLLNSRRPLSFQEISDLDEFSAYQLDDAKSAERAFERDKATLVDLGVPLRWIGGAEEDEDGGGYVVDEREYYFPELDLNPSEAALLSIAGAALCAMPGFPQKNAVQRALAKLGFDAELPGDLPVVAHTPLSQNENVELIGQRVEMLHDTIAKGERLELSYRSLGGEVVQRAIDPYGIFYRHGIWYAVAYCHLREGVRTFHLGRMEALDAGESKAPLPHFSVPTDFELSRYSKQRAWQFPEHAPVPVVLRLSAALEGREADLFGPDALVEEHDGDTFLRLDVSHQKAFFRELLPMGVNAELLAPQGWRDDLAKIYANLASRYSQRGAA